MRGGVIHQASGLRPSKSLVVRGGLVRTFGGLAGFLVVTFLCWGIYTLEDVFANPLSAGDAAVMARRSLSRLRPCCSSSSLNQGKGLE